ncbi:hypothetical protein H072_2937 [Dactylellina haptotyla CBS 200.50]|uniref:F-box domain-containing protein n=1 Tax=Dactylellina haptotyla (strain CBS 200.50) TaxID=1284197 RepID=S8C5X8_DACHA|nr:hypothetical protein H072_2937 [Dactylellina haptotyla CBS 200.50]
MLQASISYLDNLPLDLKVEILGSLDSLNSLRSLLLTSHSFFDISQTDLWNGIYARVLYRDIGIVGRTLVNVRRFKAGKTREELRTAIPTPEDEKPTSVRSHLAELLSVRRPIRFFTRQFFRIMFISQAKGAWNSVNLKDINLDAQMKSISTTEYARVEEAYYTLWFFKEANYDIARRSLEQCVALNNWTIWRQNGSLRFSPDVGILGLVLRVTNIGIIYPEIEGVLPTLSQEVKDSIRPVIDAPCLYCKHGLPSILINELGFDGVHKMLVAPQEEISATITKFYTFPLEAASEGFTQSSFITLYARLISSIWLALNREYSGNTRRVFRKPNAKYRTKVAPWNQRYSFDMAALVWDDERLSSWGYFHPVGIDHEEDKYPYDMTLENQMCSEDCDFPNCPRMQDLNEYSVLGCGFSLVAIRPRELPDFLDELLIRSTEQFDLVEDQYGFSPVTLGPFAAD